MFKKISRVFVIVLACLILVSCGKANDKTNTSAKTKQPEKQEETEPQEKQKEKKEEEQQAKTSLEEEQEKEQPKIEPQIKRFVLKNQSEIRNVLQGIFDESYDEIEERYYYFPTSLTYMGNSCVFPCIEYTNENSKYAAICFSYAGDEWVFMDRAIIKTDNNRYDEDFSGIEVYREIRGDLNYFLEERAIVGMSRGNYGISRKDYDMLTDMVNSERTIVRFSGEKSSDLELTDENKEVIRAFLSCFEEK